ncbi:hypothetical protein [Streptomyces sp. AM 2-1-1]|uniref:hypothetical protein n=1 Tax=Streptomyces sp. AM 2-1-1 TaxID=3028709 RepID=UPI0023B95A70|nr:hypothetical protein [Streptomyces sp. AM 2-1-1]WEH40809.1 hypothetical protein PZB77_15565 [Streptomyces sp. AM 2-1-1]
MSVNPTTDPQLAHRLFDPQAQTLINEYFAARAAAHPPVPETFRGPNYRKDN